MFSPNDVFALDWRTVTLVAAFDDNVVFVGLAKKAEDRDCQSATLDIQWRDLVDDLLAQQVPGVESEVVDAVEIVAET